MLYKRIADDNVAISRYPTVSALAYPYLNFGERNEEVQRAALNALTEENEGLHDGCMTVLESFFLKVC